jgi:hypothetical protein
MSSLQKFHRRTNNAPAVAAVKVIGSEAPIAGSGFYLGKVGDGTSYMYVAPRSTEVQKAWGSSGMLRNTTSTIDGVANTNTLYALGSAAHPAAYYAKTLTTGGYSTWYLPAKDELTILYSNKSATPFATADSFVGGYHWSSTENSASGAWRRHLGTGTLGGGAKNTGTYYVRAVRRSII